MSVKCEIIEIIVFKAPSRKYFQYIKPRKYLQYINQHGLNLENLEIHEKKHILGYKLHKNLSVQSNS